MPKVQQQVQSRPPWERMMRMHQLIKSGKYPNCRKLAREALPIPHEIDVPLGGLGGDLQFVR
jgi:hypothetical protein